MSRMSQMEKMEARKEYSNQWHTGLMSTMQADFPYWWLSFTCGPCVSYVLRKRALRNDMSKYVCCAGYLPCSGRCGESACPEFCLSIEVFLCFAQSVASTRFLLQDELNIQTTKWDNFIIGFIFVLQELACMFRILAVIFGMKDPSQPSQVLTLCVSDLVYFVVCACMQVQHKIEMDKRDGKLGLSLVMAPPQFQQMSRIDHPLSPSVGDQAASPQLPADAVPAVTYQPPSPRSEPSIQLSGQEVEDGETAPAVAHHSPPPGAYHARAQQ